VRKYFQSYFRKHVEPVVAAQLLPLSLVFDCGSLQMRNLIGAILFSALAASGAQAAQQLGDMRVQPLNGVCPAGMILNRMLGACVANAPNGCCAPNPQRAVCVNALPGQGRQATRTNDLVSGAVVCPR
jgi:hypothetical protein